MVNEFEVGTRQRRRYSYLEDTLSVNWLMSQFQLDVFRAFVKFELDNGANSFNTTIIGIDGIEDAEVQLINGQYSVNTVGPRDYTISASLVRVNPTTMTADMLGILSMEELLDPDVFAFTCEALFTYIELAYGDYTSNPITSEFMDLYA